LDQIEEILKKYKTIAVVGISREPDKPSFRVSKYMQMHGFRIVPVNPFVDEVLGEKCYRSLLEIPSKIQKTIEVVNIFRRAVEVPAIMEQAIKLREVYGRPYAVWMQEGIISEEAAEMGRKAGLTVVMDRCIMQEHISYLGE
jgi:predicted CoA-binding protein